MRAKKSLLSSVAKCHARRRADDGLEDQKGGGNYGKTQKGSTQTREAQGSEAPQGRKEGSEAQGKEVQEAQIRPLRKKTRTMMYGS